MSEDGRNLVSSLCTECGAPIKFELGALQVRCEHCDAGLAVDRGQRLIRLSCPGCGGNFYSLDGSMTGRCPFCDASLFALSRDRVLQYVFAPAPTVPDGAEGASLVFLSFWHLSGLVFGWDVGRLITVDTEMVTETVTADGAQVRVPSSIRRESGPRKTFRGRVIDLSIPDPTTTAFGITSLRWRAAVFPMEPYREAHESLGTIVRPTLDVDTVRAQMMDRAITLGQNAEEMNRIDCQRQDLLSEELALYFYPFWARREPDGNLRVWDGVTGELEVHGPGSEPPELGPATVFDDLKVIDLRCTACGAELVAGNRATVLPCGYCGAFYRVTRDGLERFEARYAEPHTQSRGGPVVWLPFWRVPVEVQFCGKKATRVLDLVNQLGVMRGTGKAVSAEPHSQLHYFVSAYGSLKAPRIDHAARDLTRAQPALTAADRGDGDRYRCFFEAEDAREMAYATWMQVLPSAVPHQLRSLRLKPGEPSLWYVPFEMRGRLLANLVTENAYERATFRGVSH